MGFDDERIEDVRAAALLHDIGKLDISREVLYKAARLNATESEEMRSHVTRGINLLEPVGGREGVADGGGVRAVAPEQVDDQPAALLGRAGIRPRLSAVFHRYILSR